MPVPHVVGDLKLALGGALAGLLAGCSAATPAASGDGFGEHSDALGVEIPTCSQPTASLYDKSTQTLSVNLTASASTAILATIDGYITVNGYACVKTTADGGGQLAPSQVKNVLLTGTSADNEKVVIDLMSGSLGTGILSGTGGITVDLGSGAGDEFSLRGTALADRITAGEAGGDTFFEINGDTRADIRVSHVDSLAISTGAGNDTLSGRGGAIAAGHLASGVASLAAATQALTVYGGDGDDTLNGGDGNDTLNGGLGNDSFKTAATADGADVYNGDDGTDKLDYSGRTLPLSVLMDGAFSSGQGVSGMGAPAAEGDHVSADTEDLVGGSGNDFLQGNQLANHIVGGSGDDRLSGGLAGDCALDLDSLDGGAGDDTFDQGALNDCADSLTGGTGSDRVDYQQRGSALVISLDGVANDGEGGEQDNVRVDIEVVLGGSGADTITGSAAADELHGGPQNDSISGAGGNDILIGDSGDDTINGDAGYDTFLESGTDPAYASGSEQRGLGDDTINGGAASLGGTDTVDYSQRSANLALTICSDLTQLKGASGSSAAACTDADGDASLGEADQLVNVQHLLGGSGADTLKGGAKDDLLEGGSGADTIYGGAGNDTLFGDAGVDSLYGGAGDDYVDGVGGVDAVIDGDDGTNSSDADICITDAGETAMNCEL